jgi:hypothetical protein
VFEEYRLGSAGRVWDVKLVLKGMLRTEVFGCLMGIRWEVFVVGLPCRNPRVKRNSRYYIKFLVLKNVYGIGRNIKEGREIMGFGGVSNPPYPSKEGTGGKRLL